MSCLPTYKNKRYNSLDELFNDVIPNYNNEIKTKELNEMQEKANVQTKVSKKKSMIDMNINVLNNKVKEGDKTGKTQRALQSQDILNRQVIAREWINSHLKGVTLEFINGMIDTGRGYALGSVFESTIKLSNTTLLYGNDESLIYHEAFHHIFDNVLSENHRLTILDDAKEYYGTNDYSILIELLAESYRQYEITKQKEDLPFSILQVLKDFLKFVIDLTGLFESSPDIKSLFEDISNGVYQTREMEIENTVELSLGEGKLFKTLDLINHPYLIYDDIYVVRTLHSNPNYAENTLYQDTGFTPEQVLDGVKIVAGRLASLNSSEQRVLRNGKFETIKFSNITVRDLIQDPSLNPRQIIIAQFKNDIEDLKDENQDEFGNVSDDIQKVIHNIDILIHNLESKYNSTYGFYREARKYLNGFLNSAFMDYEDIVKLQNDDLPALTRMYDNTLYKDSEEKNFRPITKLSIAESLEYKSVNGEIEATYSYHFASPIYVDYNILFPKIQEDLLNIASMDEMMDRIKSISSYHPNYKIFYDMLEANKDLKAAWFTDFSKTSDPVTALVLNIDNTIGISKLNKSNQDKIIERLYNSINLTQASFKALTNNEMKGKSQLVYDKLKQLTYDSSFTEDVIKSRLGSIINNIVYSLNTLGIPITAYQVNSNFIDLTTNAIGTSLPQSYLQILSNYIISITALEKYHSSAYANTNPKHAINEIEKLSIIIKKYSMYKVENTYLNGEKNKKQDIIKFNKINKTFANLNSKDSRVRDKEIKKLLDKRKDRSFQYSNLLGSWEVTNKKGLFKSADSNGIEGINYNALDRMGIEIYDSTINRKNGKVGTYKSQSYSEAKYTNLMMYLAKENKDSITSMIRIPSLVPGDALNTHIFKFPRLPLNEGVKFAKFNNDLNITSINTHSLLYKALLNIFYQEKTRIEDAKSLMMIQNKKGNWEMKSDEVLDNIMLIQDYHYILDKDGDRVYKIGDKPTGSVFQFHNLPLFNSNLNGISLGILDKLTFSNAEISRIIKESVVSLYTRAKNEYSVFEKEFKDSKIETDLSFSELILEMSLNQLVYNSEQQILFFGVTALYGNFSKATKRYKKENQKGNTGSNTGSYKNIICHDKEYITPSLDLYSDLFDKSFNNDNTLTTEEKEVLKDELLKDYSDSITESDGFSVATSNFFYKVVSSYGRKTDYAALFNEKNELREDLNAKELKNLIQSLKPIHVESKVHTMKDENGEEHSINISIYQKLSTFIVSKLFAKENSELDTIRKAMEAQDIDQITFYSSRKAGAYNVASLFHTYGELKGQLNMDTLTSLSKYSEELQFENYVLQLEVPDHIRDTMNKLGVQFYKTVIANINDNDIYILQNKSKITGKELKALHHKLMARIIEEDYKEMIKRFKLNDDIYNKKEFIRLLKEEGFKRNFTFDDMHLLDLVEATMGTINEVNLGFSKNDSKLTAVLNSIFKNSIIDTKFNGGHVVLLSDVFKNSDKEYDENLKSYWNEDKSLYIVECKLPAWSNDFINSVTGELLPIESLSDDLKTMIGYRVPISSPHSTMVLKVVGFTNPIHGSSIVTIPEMIFQTGWDFDIDSLYLLMKPHKRSKNGFKTYNYNNFTYSDYIDDYLIRTYSKSKEGLQYNAELQDFFSTKKSLISKLTSFKTNKNQFKAELDILQNIEELENELESNMSLSKEDEKELQDRVQELYSEIFYDDSYADLEIELAYTYEDINKVKAELQDIRTNLKAIDLKIKNLKQKLIETLMSENEVLGEEEFTKALKTNRESILNRNQMQTELIDIWSTILSQNSTLYNRMLKSSFKDNNKAIKLIDDIVGDNFSNLNVIDPIDQLQIRRNSVESKQMLTICASTKSITEVLKSTNSYITPSNPIITKHDIVKIKNRKYVKFGDKKTDIILLSKFKERYDVYSETDKNIHIVHTKMGWTNDDSSMNFESRPILYSLGEDVDHTVDANGNRLIPNITGLTIPKYLLMKQLGFGTNYIALFMNQMAIKEVNKAVDESNLFTRNKNTKGTIESNGVILDKLYALLYNKEREFGDKFIENEAKTNQLFIDTLDNTNFSIAELKELLKQGVNYESLSKDDKIKYLLSQRRILQYYEKIQQTQESLSTEVKYLSVDKFNAALSFDEYTNYIGYMDSLDNVEAQQNTLLKIDSKPAIKEILKGDAYPTFAAYYKYGVEIPYTLLSPMFWYETSNIKSEIIGEFVTEFKYYSDKARIVNMFRTHILELSMQNHYLLKSDNVKQTLEELGLIETKNQNIFTIFNENNPIFTKYSDYIIPYTLPNNPTLKLFKFTNYSNNQLNYIHSLINQDLKEYKDSIRRGNKDVELERFLHTIMKYSFYKDGFKEKHESLNKIITTEMFDYFGIYKRSEATMQGYNELIENGDYEQLRDSFLIANFNNNSLVPYFDSTVFPNLPDDIDFEKYMQNGVSNEKPLNLQKDKWYNYKHLDNMDNKLRHANIVKILSRAENGYILYKANVINEGTDKETLKYTRILDVTLEKNLNIPETRELGILKYEYVDEKTGC